MAENAGTIGEISLRLGASIIREHERWLKQKLAQ